MPGQRIEQRPRLRAEEPPATATVVVRGGRDTPEKLRSHVQRTARAWSLDGQPLLGISVFAVLGEPLEGLLRRRFATFRTIYLPTVGGLADRGFGWRVDSAARADFQPAGEGAGAQPDELGPVGVGEQAGAAASGREQLSGGDESQARLIMPGEVDRDDDREPVASPVGQERCGSMATRCGRL